MVHAIIILLAESRVHPYNTYYHTNTNTTSITNIKEINNYNFIIFK